MILFIIHDINLFMIQDIKKQISRLKKHLKRQYKDPKYIARANLVGIGMAFAPFPGQTPVIIALWLLSKKLHLKFSLITAIAWSFISNIFTNIPLFYLYYVTGNFILQKPNTIDFKNINFETINQLGTSFFLGSIFYMTIFGTLGYFIGLCILRKKKL